MFPLVAKRKNKFLAYLEENKYKISLYSFETLVCINLVIRSFYEKQIGTDKIPDLLNIQWIIFSISIALFIVLNAFVIKKINSAILEFKKISDYFGKEKNKVIDSISDTKLGNDYALVTILFIFTNLILLIISTISYYVLDISNKKVLNIFIVLSFYFCTNTLILVLINIINPMLDLKKSFQNKLKEIGVNDIEKIRTEALIEEAIAKETGMSEESLNNYILQHPEKKKVLDKLKEKLLDSLNDKNYQQEQKKTLSNDDSTESK